MIEPSIPANEQERLQVLKEYAVLDTLPEKDFDNITMLASQICGTPISTITLIDSNRQWFKSKIGLKDNETSREFSFCAHAINTPEKIFIVTDSRNDKRFIEHPSVRGEPHIIFYAGVPLVTDNGYALGTLCVADEKPRRLTKDQQEALKALSNQVMQLFELRRKNVLLDEKQTQLQTALDLFEQTSNVSRIGGWNVDFINNKITFTKIARDIHEIPDDFNLNIETGIQFYKPGENRKKIKELVKQALKKEMCYDAELQIVTSKGNERWVKTKGTSVFENNKCVRLYGTIQDITAEKLKDIQLAQSEKLFRQTLNNAPTGIALVSIEGNWIKVNKSLCDMIGYTEEELLHINFQKITHPDDLQEDLQYVEAVLKGEIQSYQLEKRYIHKDGSIIWILLSVSLVRNNAGKPLYFIVHIMDISSKIKNRQARKEERELLYTLINNLPVNIFIKDLESRKTLVNKREIEYLGLKNEREVLGKNDFDLYPFESAVVSHEEDMYVFNTGTSIMNKETMSVKPDGSKHWFLTSKIPLRNQDNKITGLLGISYGIDERKAAEEALKQAEQRWKFALEGSGDAIWEYDLETEKIFYSDQYKKILGYKNDDEAYQYHITAWKDYIHPEDFKRVEGTGEKYKKGIITTHHFEYRMQRQDGDYVWLLNRGMLVEKNTNGAPKKVIGTITNINAQKKLEFEFKSAANRLSNLISNMRDGIMVADENRRVVLVNKMFCDMFSIKAHPEAIKGLPCVIVNEKNKSLFKYPEKFIDVTDKAFSNKKPFTEEILELADGRIFRREYVPIFIDNNYAGYFWKYSNITLQKVLEQQLREAKQDAEQSAQAKEMFLANMSHEIRTPMNAVLGISRQLQKTSMNEQQQFYVKSINGAASNLLVLINDILDFSKIEAGQLKLEKIGFHLAEIINQTMQVMLHKAEEKGIDLSANIDKTLSPVLIGDPFRINQVLLNLLSNALKFTEKGSVNISCVVMRNVSDEQFICIEVTDTGVGMSQEFIHNMYDKFIQEDESIGRKYGGTGLGMSIIKQLVELMKGQMHVESEKGKGTSVKIFIAFEKGSEDDLPGKADTKSDSGLLQHKRILVAEDNEMNRVVATTILHEYGAFTEVAVDGKQAVNMLKANVYDLVLMDMRMPIMDGIEATNLIRKEVNKTIPIIALTANAFTGGTEKCLQAGMNDFIAKPFEEYELINVIAKWLKIDASLSDTIKSEVLINSTELFNLDKLRKISRGDEKFVRKMLQIFVQETTQALEEINTANAKHDYKKVRALAHKIKPSVANMTIDSIKEDVLQLENFDAAITSAEQVTAQVNKITAVLNQVFEQIKIMNSESVFIS